ncbi:MAG: M1 family metallopeptidase [Pseudomonadota bacterium]|nr:M1 family metallopeptidase [Pseudomonadota bacterium]
MTRSNTIRLGLALALIILIGLIALTWMNREKPKGDLTAFTRGTGAPLTAEQQSVNFTHADLTFRVDPARKAIEGRSILTFDVRRPIAKIQFDLDRDLPIEAIAVDGQPLDEGRWSNPEGRATVELPRTYNAGQRLQLAIDYGGKPHVAKRAPWDGGFVWSKTPQGEPWVATAIQGEGCDIFWPCFDNSLVEVGTVDLHIDVPEGLVAPGNGRFMGVTAGKDGRRVWNWRAKSPNNYAISLNVAPYKELRANHESRFGNVIPMHFWYLPGNEEKAKRLFNEFGPTIDFFERNIGPYPFGAEKVAAVETPHLGMEHQTINAYGNEYKPSQEGYDWLFHHEFAHEWFGNQLTNRDWDDMWLHEGFGSYMQPLYIRERQGQMAYHAMLWKQRAGLLNRFPVVSGKLQLEHEVYNPETGPGGDIYAKGAAVLHTLREHIGDEPFLRAVRRLVYGRPDPAPGNFAPRYGTTGEFVGLTSQEAGRDLKWFFDVYIRSAQLPRLSEQRRGNVLLLQWRTPRGLPFPMPVEVRVDGRVQTVPMTGGRGSVTLPGANSVWTVDPGAKVLRQNDSIDRFRDWTAAEAKTAEKS